MNKTKLLIGAGIILLLVVWYLFRPERLIISKTINEDFPVNTDQADNKSDTTKILYQGSFHGVAHDTKGTATIYQSPDGKMILRFTEFETSNGPDVQVYLIAANDANDNETVTSAGFIHLAALKGNIGDQNYELPSDVDLNRYRAVTIWCKRFGVNFGTAPLVNKNS